MQTILNENWKTKIRQCWSEEPWKIEWEWETDMHIVYVCEVVAEEDGDGVFIRSRFICEISTLADCVGAIVLHLSYADLQCDFVLPNQNRERASSPLCCIYRIYENGAEAVGYILHMYLCNWKFNRNVYPSGVKLKCRWVEYKPTHARTRTHKEALSRLALSRAESSEWMKHMLNRIQADCVQNRDPNYTGLLALIRHGVLPFESQQLLSTLISESVQNFQLFI